MAKQRRLLSLMPSAGSVALTDTRIDAIAA